MADAPTSDRRGFLKVMTGLLAAAAGALATIPIFASVLSPLREGRADGQGALRACPLEELETGKPKRVELISTIVDGWTRAVGVVGAAWLLKKPDGSISALSSVCPHSGCSINQKSPSAYGCPCHDSTFELDGTATDGPSPRAMDPLEVELHGKDVFVKWKRFKIGVKERQELG
jgi:menaquinol-cytochrome c reductase iron-sulfur subunit